MCHVAIRQMEIDGFCFVVPMWKLCGVSHDPYCFAGYVVRQRFVRCDGGRNIFL